MMRLYKVKDSGETFKIIAGNEQLAAKHLKKYYDDTNVSDYDEDEFEIELIQADTEVTVDYHEEGVTLSLTAREWAAVLNSATPQWNILCSSAWTL